VLLRWLGIYIQSDIAAIKHVLSLLLERQSKQQLPQTGEGLSRGVDADHSSIEGGPTTRKVDKITMKTLKRPLENFPTTRYFSI
jgi:hypothetical protein